MKKNVHEEPQPEGKDTAHCKVTSSWDMMPFKQKPKMLQAIGFIGSAWALDINVKYIHQCSFHQPPKC